MKVLLLKLKDQELWSLPGGYIKKDEDTKDAANRILNDRTGGDNIYLQFRFFAEMGRSEDFFTDYDDGLRHKQRFITLGFYALADFAAVNPVVDIFSSICQG